MQKKFVSVICFCLLSACGQAETFTKKEDGETFYYFQAQAQDANLRLCEKAAEVRASRKAAAAALKRENNSADQALLSGIIVEDKQSVKKNGKFVCKVTVKISQADFNAAGEIK